VIARVWFLRARKRRWVAAVVLSVMLVGVASAAGANPTAGVVVPRTGGGVLAAYQRLHARGLRVSIPHRFLFDSTAPPRVLRAVPSPGRRLPPGSVVTLYLSRGTYRPPTAAAPFPRYRVPRFVGATADRVYGWVRARTLVFRAYLGALNGGGAGSLLANYRVTSQRPVAGRRLALGLSGRVAGRKRTPVGLSPLTVWGVQHHPARPPRTPPPPPPQAQTASATAVSQTTATLAGTVNPEGSPTGYYFTYGPTTAYGSQTTSQPVGSASANVTVTGAIASLAPATTYHYRAVATSRAGTSYGADQTFTTTGYYQNPVFSAAAFPDPFVLDNGGGHTDYWAFATGDLFPLLHSTDLVNWSAAGPAMTARPAWVTGAGDWHPWAPSVLQSPAPCPGSTSGACYVMYYVGLSAQPHFNCIATATASSPGGPYTDHGPLDLAAPTDPNAPPLGCADDAGQGNIDPSPFIDPSGQSYLYVSTDFACTSGNCTLQPTISVIPLSSDLVHAAGPRRPLFSGDPGTWEQAGVGTPTVEGPSVTLHNGTYYLLYSGGNWRGAYGMGYATATSPTGPFTKSPSNPILSEAANVLSPGGGDQPVTGPHGGLWMVYAARTSSYSEPRTLHLDPFTWQPAASPGTPDSPVIHGPTASAQPNQP
jgi:Glycosyl hydrolases family 43